MEIYVDLIEDWFRIPFDHFEVSNKLREDDSQAVADMCKANGSLGDYIKMTM